MFDVPVLLIAYNRVELTRRLIDELRKQNVSKIYFAVDGSKSIDSDSAAVNEVKIWTPNWNRTPASMAIITS
mgnify:CR=1 FL=1